MEISWFSWELLPTTQAIGSWWSQRGVTAASWTAVDGEGDGLILWLTLLSYDALVLIMFPSVLLEPTQQLLLKWYFAIAWMLFLRSIFQWHGLYGRAGYSGVTNVQHHFMARACNRDSFFSASNLQHVMA
jgi:hypothetical protein